VEIDKWDRPHPDHPQGTSQEIISESEDVRLLKRSSHTLRSSPRDLAVGAARCAKAPLKPDALALGSGASIKINSVFAPEIISFIPWLCKCTRSSARLV